ncbi:MAG: Gfo/Idh/MocA family oxidoreductase [Planctomycetia bacterium]|nr:Gfo/Idh/MocA family oxidoreductase [Planctomycetia bacterium]
MKQHTAVVVGAGFIGPVHVEALRRAGVHVAGILGSSPEKSQAVAERLGLPQGYRDFAAVLADREVDVVHLTTPNRFHFEQASAVLRAGKHVLCEKPLAMNSRETAELVALAQQSGLAAGVAYNIRFYPLCHEAAARISGQVAGSGTGRVFHVTGSYVQDWLLNDTDFNWRVLAADGGELRAVADIGTHWLDLVQFILQQKVVAVCADLHTVHPVRQAPLGSVETFTGGGQPPSAVRSVPITTDDYGSILLRFADGARGVVSVSQVAAGRKNCLRFEIASAAESLAWDSERPNELWIGRRDRPNELLLRDPALLSAAARGITDYPGGHNEGFPDTFKQLFKAFYGYLDAGDFSLPPPFPTFADGHHEVVLCEAVLRSHRERRWVALEEIEK